MSKSPLRKPSWHVLFFATAIFAFGPVNAAGWDETAARDSCRVQLGTAFCALERCVWAACVVGNAPKARSRITDLPGRLSQMELEAAPVCYPRHKVLKDCLKANQPRTCEWMIGGVWHIIQSDGQTFSLTLSQEESLVSGRANLGRAIASVTGSLEDGRLDIFVTWSATSRIWYSGIVTAGVITGTSYDERHQHKQETWSATGPAVCVTPR